MKSFVFWFKFHWNASQWSPQYANIGLDNGLAPNGRQVIIWTSCGQFTDAIYTSLGMQYILGDKLDTEGDNLKHYSS